MNDVEGASRTRRCGLLLCALAIVGAALAGTGGAVATATAGDAAALEHDPAGEETDVEFAYDRPANYPVWRGMRVGVTGFYPNETVEFRHDSEVLAVEADQGVAVVETEGLPLGEWTVEGRSTGRSETVELEEQWVNASVEPASTGDGTTLTIETNRHAFRAVIGVAGVEPRPVDDAFAEHRHDVSWRRGVGTNRTFGLPVRSDDRQWNLSAAELPIGTHQFVIEAEETTGSATAALTVRGEPPYDDADVEAAFGELDGRTVLQGQRVGISGLQDGERVTITSAAESLQARADADGYVAFDTTLFEAGTEYAIERPDGDADAVTIEAQQLELDASAAASPGGTATVAVQSPREDYDVRLRSAGTRPETFAEAIPDGTLRESEDALAGEAFLLPGDGEFDVDTDALYPGDYELVATATDSTATARTTLTVEEQPLALDATEAVSPEGTATLALQLPHRVFEVRLRSETVPREALADAIPAARLEASGDPAGELLVLHDEGEFDVDTGALPPGDHEIVVEDRYGSRLARTNLTVGEWSLDAADLEGGERLYDVTGDGTVGQTDVLAFFRHQHRENWKRPSLFDFTGDGAVGHGDVVELFEVVATGGP